RALSPDTTPTTRGSRHSAAVPQSTHPVRRSRRTRSASTAARPPHACKRPRLRAKARNWFFAAKDHPAPIPTRLAATPPGQNNSRILVLCGYALPYRAAPLHAQWCGIENSGPAILLRETLGLLSRSVRRFFALQPAPRRLARVQNSMAADRPLQT